MGSRVSATRGCAGLVQAYLRASGLVGVCVDLQHRLHGPDNRGVGLRRDHPRLLPPGLKVVVLSVVRTHSGPLVATMSKATSLSAHRVSVHRARPSGGALQATAISWASWAPSSWRYGRPVGGLRANAASRPCSTPAWRTRWTVEALVSTASAISAAVQWRAPASTAALSQRRAWSSFAAAAPPVLTRVSHCSRASGRSRTTYVTIRALLWGVTTERRTDNPALVNLARLRH